MLFRSNRLSGAETFEPQNGEYLGEVGINFQLCKDGDTECWSRIGNIPFVISDSDLYEFSNGIWKSYAFYQQNLSGLMQRISKWAS